MGAFKEMGAVDRQNQPQLAIDRISEPRSWGQGRRIGTMPGGSGVLALASTRHRGGWGCHWRWGLDVPVVCEISTRLGDQGLHLREDRHQAPLRTSRCGMTTCWQHLLSLLVSRETRPCHWTLSRGADSNVGPLPDSNGAASLKSGISFRVALECSPGICATAPQI